MSNKFKSAIKKKDLLLTQADIKNNMDDPKVNNLDRMCHTPLYIYRIKSMLYDSGKISARGFLFNDNIYSLPIGKKNAKGEILIDSKVMEFMDRFMLAEEFVDKGDTLTAFMIDHDDIFYNVFDVRSSDDIADEQYANDFNESYIRISNLLLNYEVSNKISDDEKLFNEVNVYEDKLEELATKHTLENGE